MLDPTVLRILLLRSQPCISTQRATVRAAFALRFHCTTSAESLSKDQKHPKNNNRGKWFTLPPYTSSTVNGSALGKTLTSTTSAAKSAIETTALKWVLQCCPDLPRSLVQKLFRLRQVRRELLDTGSCDQAQECGLKRVAAKESMKVGDRIFLPSTVNVVPAEKQVRHCSENEVNFIRGLELYKDDAVIVVNKPSGMPVQGGFGIKTSLDELAAACLCYDCPEPPRLVHRLDMDSSGILVMGRTQTSTTVLHSIFREKTFAASDDDLADQRRILQRRYWALVIGSPRCPMGLIAAPLGKVLLENGKSDRMTVVDRGKDIPSQHAVTAYRTIASSLHGYTWLELSPLTGRKHQLRVHCAEILGTPIVGDYKYAWQAHRNWKPLPFCNLKDSTSEKVSMENVLPFGLDLKSGSISEKHPRLHLHCKQMVLPNVCQALQNAPQCSDYDLSQLELLNLDAPLPSYMKRSWDILSS